METPPLRTVISSPSTARRREVSFSMKAAGDRPSSSQDVATASKDAWERERRGGEESGERKNERGPRAT